MHPDVIIAVVFTILIIMVLTSIFGLFTTLFFFKKNTVNNIDVLVFELSREGHQTRYEKGRFEHNTKHGKALYTVGTLPYSIKDKLGYNFSDNDICPTKGGLFGKRYFIAVAGKDNLFAPIQAKRVPKELKLTEEERNTFKEISSKLLHPVNLTENPETLSLKPVKHAQLRFALDVTKDAQDIYRNADKEFAKTMMKYAVLFAFAVLVFAVVVIVILITQGGSLADAAANVAAKAPLPPG